ncbi:hypothetical protein KUTeg_021241 [Tegillarca granosa]|uniref:Uncharacterized protein n=1 Tax=Tegillarca granosa TaxID=220873 RepID=A0ABQ9EA76_TEGGR|nr:hypothetical protein KUTeg_021241 [Tegillarca granosa]
MPLMDHMFRSNRDDVQGLLKNLQFSTRALHHMCGHSKGDEILSQSLSESMSKSRESGGEEEEEGDATVPDDDEESDVVSVYVLIIL